MERILIICGIWLFFLPLMKWNYIIKSKKNKKVSISCLCYFNGVSLALIGLNDILRVVNNQEVLMMVEYFLLAFLTIVILIRKIKNMKFIIEKIAIAISICLIAISAVILFLDATESASACVILIGVIMVLVAPYEGLFKRK